MLPKDAFVWKDEYELIYDSTHGVGSRTRESGDAHNPPVLSTGKPPVELNFNPPVEDDMKPLVQAALDAIGTVKNDVSVNSGEKQSSEVNTPQQVALVPPAPAPVGADASNVKPWLLPDPKDPPIVSPKDQPWYTPARYFARQLVLDDTTLLTKKQVLAEKVSKSLAGTGIFKRGGKKPHSPETVLKAFANVTLG